MLRPGSQIGLVNPSVTVIRNVEFDLAKAAQFLSADAAETVTLDAAQALIGIVSAAPAEKHIDVVAKLVAALPHVNHRDKFGSTALIEACDRGNAECVSLLLAAQAEVELFDNGKRTALHWAAMRGHTEVVAQLIGTAGRSNGITHRSFGTQSKKGFTPLALAQSNRQERHRQVVALIEEAMRGELGAGVEPEVEPEV